MGVLHVDDDPDFLDLTTAFLERDDARFEVETATSARGGLNRLRDGPVDCVVSDYDMPGDDGIEFLESVREEFPELPFILFTGKGSEEIASKAISAGVTDYLQKAGTAEQYALLANRIRNAVTGYQAKQAVAKSEARLRRVYERIDDGFFAVNRDWEYTYVNEEAANLVDRSPDDLLGQRVWEAFPDLAASPFGDVLRTAMEAQDVQDLEEYYPPHDTWYDVTAYPADDGISIYFRDVSDRKDRVEHRRLMEQLLEAVNDGLVLAQDGIIEYTNPSAADLLGLPENAATGRAIGEFVAPEYRELVENRHEARLAGAAEDLPPVYEVVLLTDAGDRVPVEVNVSRVTYEGEPATVSILRDVSSRRKRGERVEALHDATRELMTAETPAAVAAIAVETTSDILGMPMNGIMFHDEAENVLEPVATSEAARELLGPLPTFEPGNSLAWEVFETGEMKVFEDVSQAAGRYNPDTEIRSEVILPLGEYGVMNIGSTDVGRFDDTSVSLARILAANLQAALVRADREVELARQNERLAEFSSFVSHDLRNPVSVAAGQLALAREDCDSEHLAAIDRAIDRMDALIDDLLELAADGQVTPDLRPVDLADTVEDAWRTLETEDATLRVDTDRAVRADRDRLRQLLENLFRNAGEHADGPVRITVGDLRDGFYVGDDGPGIPESKREAVFETGYSTAETGTGFGLAIVRRIADAHGWDIHVRASDDGGTRFEFCGVDSS
jgi:PAS domain S-box-containing protein